MRILKHRKMFSKTTLEKPFLNEMETDYIDNEGSKKIWQWASRPNNPKTVVIVATVRNKLVLIEEFRIPAKGNIIALPAGMVEPGEDIYEAAEKELFEETGLSIDTACVRRNSPMLYNSPGMTDEQSAIVFVKAKGKLTNKNIGASEMIMPMLKSCKEVINLLEDASNKKIKMGTKVWFACILFCNYKFMWI